MKFTLIAFFITLAFVVSLLVQSEIIDFLMPSMKFVNLKRSTVVFFSVLMPRPRLKLIQNRILDVAIVVSVIQRTIRHRASIPMH